MAFYQLKKFGGDINPNCFEFYPSENWIISVLGSVINVHNFSTGGLINCYEYHNLPIISIALIVTKNNTELFSFDESGLIKCVNMKSDSIVFSFHIRESILNGFINKRLKKICYTTKKKESSLNIFNFFNNEISKINFVAEEQENEKYHGLRSSRDENFAIHFQGKTIIIYDLLENKVLNTINHDNFVTVLDLNNDNSILAVGDVIGKIYLYYNPLTAKDKIKTSKFHWHCQKVISLKFNAISNVLLSGGYEVLSIC